MLNFFREEDYEKSLIELFQNDLEYEYVYGPDIERDFYSPFYEDLLIESLYRINHGATMMLFRTHYLNLKILKMGSLYRRMPSLWTTYRMVFL